MLVVGLTGGIATGKSTVSTTFRQKNFAVIDADVIAREVVDPGRKAYQQVLAAFSDVPDLVLENGALNRPALGKAVFGNKQRLGQLNSIVHPAVKKEIVRQLLKAYVSGNSLVILDVPLLFESGLHLICGLVVTVSCHPNAQLERLLARNPELSKEDAQKRIDSQMSNEERNFRADLVIDNSKGLPELKKSIDSVLAEITPSWFWTYLDWIPPVGILLALYTVTLRFFRDYFKNNRGV